MRGRGFVQLGIVILILLLVPSRSASSNDFLAPLLAPIFEHVCEQVECGRGRCKATNKTYDNFNFSFPFECECESGWKRPGPLTFLPCVIPNCTLDLSCSGAAPSSSPESLANSSSSDPCQWNICGGHGMCNKNSSGFSYACSCSQGYSNLMNSTSMPCLRECALGGDCQKLGITMFNQSTTASPPSSSSDITDDNASSCLQSFWLLVMFLVVSTAIIAWTPDV